jgi:peptide chain release factor subunit 1
MTAGTYTGELRAQRATRTAVVSLYLNIPVDLADHRGLVTRARDLIKEAGGDPAQTAQAAPADTEAIAAAITGGALDWLGRTMAIFACAELDLLEVISLPGPAADLAVVAAKPYIRPLLATVQRNPPYQVAVIDTKHAWLLGVAGDEIDTLAERTGREVPSTRFAGWYGLQAYRIEQRIMELSKQHYRDTISVLAELNSPPLVLGGQEMQISNFVQMLPQSVRQRLAGSFRVDLQTATPGRVRELSAPVIADWTNAGEAQLVNDVLAEPPGTAVLTDLGQCLGAARSRAVSQLVLAGDQMVPGCACDNCGALGVELSAGGAPCDCPDPQSSCRQVPDVLDELTSQALDGGSEVTAVREAPFAAAARLRFQPAWA